MLDVLASLSGAQIGWLIIAAFGAGLVRGFTGFGSGLVFMPVAAQILPPFSALLAMTLMDIVGPLPNAGSAWRQVNRGDLYRLILGCLCALPLGLWLLTQVSPEVFQISVSLTALGMLAILALGLRYRGEVGNRTVTGIGAGAGFIGGMAGLPGPPVILFYLSRPLPVPVIRATILLFLMAYDLMLMGVMAAFGRLVLPMALLGLALAVPNMLGNLIGAALFQPRYERYYRAAAYSLIAIAALSALPVWR